MEKKFPYLLTVLSIVGLLASFLLMTDTIQLIKDPAAELPCNINPFISCGNSILSEQGEIFGFPNPLLGIISFSMTLSLGMLLVTGNAINERIMLLLNLGLLGSMIFVIWFYYQSLFNLGTLCIYCMTVWVATWPLFLFTTTKNYQNGFLGKSKIGKVVFENQIQVLIIGYILAVAGIILKFKDYFLS